MCGCRICGAIDGTPDRLCERCFQSRFRAVVLVSNQVIGASLEGYEISPRGRVALLSGAIALYLVIVIGGLSVSVQHTGVTKSDPHSDFLYNDSGYRPLNLQGSYHSISAPEKK